jgi:hypothetical protein
VAINSRERYLDFVTAMFTAWKPTVREAARSLLSPQATQSMEQGLGTSLDCKPSDIDTERWVTAFLTVDALGDNRVWQTIAGAHERLDRQQAGLEKRSRTTVTNSRDHGRRRPGNR